jgi:hypothetical protein
MAGPAPDELAGGSARDPFRAPRWLRAAALVAVTCLAGWVLVAQHPSTHDSGSRRPPGGVARPAPITLTPSPAQRAVVLGSQPGLLGVRAVCLLAGRDHALSLGVDLVNGRLARTTLLAVTRVVAVGDSARGGATLPARRTCEGRPAARDSLVMRPGGVVPLRVDLQGTDLCGERPVSVQVDVSFLGPGESPATQRLDLHPDPDELDVQACASP